MTERKKIGRVKAHKPIPKNKITVFLEPKDSDWIERESKKRLASESYIVRVLVSEAIQARKGF